MNTKYKILGAAALLTAAAFLTASCTLTSTPPALSLSGDLAEFQGKYMTTFDILNNSFTQSGRAFSPFNTPVQTPTSRATVNVTSLVDENGDPVTITYAEAVAGTAVHSLSNYPEVGQTSSWTVESAGNNGPNDFHKITVTTTFPSYDPRASQVESYYLVDRDPSNTAVSDGKWNTADTVCDNTGNDDATYRAVNVLTYRDGSTQEEAIKDVDSRFSPFDINSSLDYPGAFMPIADAGAEYSSVVVYTRNYSDAPDFSFWSGNRVRTIVGVRYYTEKLTADHQYLIGTMIVFEKAITSLMTSGGDFTDYYSSLFLPQIDAEPNQSYLALSVIRQQTTYKVASYVSDSQYTLDYNQSTRDTRAKTRVVNIPAQQDNYVTLINDEAAAITDAPTTLWIPSGDDPAIVNLSGDAAVDVETKNVVVTTGDTTPVAIVLADPGTGDISTLYNSVTDGTLSNELVSTDITGDLTGVGDVQVFNGHQGIELPVGNTYAFHDKGTIQAWVYIVTPTNFGGIVHSGHAADFSDEIWSLQFWGSNNTPSFSLSSQNSYKFDYVTSRQRLNNNKWHYLAATWDLAGNNMSIYVDGLLKGSARFRNVSTSSNFAAVSPVVVGSQFYDANKVLSGYYGVNGKINGVLIDHDVWSAAQIRDFYNANKAKTASW